MKLGAGEMLDSYRIVAPLRMGGMARLYLARREGAAGFARPVAIKVIHPHLAKEPGFRERFIEEARLSASIVDPNVVQVEGLGESGGTLYLAMEYVHGVSLAELLRELVRAKRRLSVVTAAYIASRAAAGLHAAHETTDTNGTPLGIVHRDVSPHNMLVAFTGHVKVIDFGVAKAIGPTPDASGVSLCGKLGYMSPEQAHAKNIDRRADVYALGIVLWELLTSRTLFAADNEIALLTRVRAPKIEAPSTYADVPAALEAAVMKALEPAPEARFATCADFGRALADAVPEIRTCEPADLGALLKALVPKELEERVALLARVGGDAAKEPVVSVVRTREAAAPSLERTTEVRLRPDEALAQLTLPIAPAPVPAFAEPSGTKVTSRNDTTAATRNPPSSPLVWLAAALLLVSSSIVLFGIVQKRPAPAAIPEATASVIAVPDPLRAPPADAPSAVVAVEDSAALPPAPAPSSSTPRSVRRDPLRRTAREARPASSDPIKVRSDCKMVGGVELCQ